MAWDLTSELQSQVKDDKEYGEGLFESEESDTSSETEDVENVEGMDGMERERKIEDDEEVIR